MNLGPLVFAIIGACVLAVNGQPLVNDAPSGGSVESVPIVKVFRLKNVNARETARQLSTLFSGGTTKINACMPPISQSERVTRQTAVLVVPDLRTTSIIVTCSRDLMKEIEEIVTQLDQLNIYSFDIDHGDARTVQAALTALFTGSKTQTNTAMPVKQLESSQTVVKVFHLKNGDAQEIGDTLSNLFAVPSQIRQNFNCGMCQDAIRVVPDVRAKSIVVSCPRDYIKAIENMITSWDHKPPIVRNVYFYDTNHPDPETINKALDALFPGYNNNTLRQGSF